MNLKKKSAIICKYVENANVYKILKHFPHILLVNCLMMQVIG